MSEPKKTIDLVELREEIAEQLHNAEIATAELRGQLALVDRLMREAKHTRTGEPLGEQEA